MLGSARTYTGFTYFTYRLGESVINNESLRNAYTKQVQGILARVNPSDESIREERPNGHAGKGVPGHMVAHYVAECKPGSRARTMALSGVSDDRIIGVFAMATLCVRQVVDGDANTADMLAVAKNFEKELHANGFRAVRHEAMVEVDKKTIEAML